MKALTLYVIFGCLSIVFAAPPISNKKHIEDNNVDSKEKDSDVKENLVISQKYFIDTHSFRKYNLIILIGRLHGVS